VWGRLSVTINAGHVRGGPWCAWPPARGGGMEILIGFSRALVEPWGGGKSFVCRGVWPTCKWRRAGPSWWCGA
jgi:hypothetical protein